MPPAVPVNLSTDSVMSDPPDPQDPLVIARTIREILEVTIGMANISNPIFRPTADYYCQCINICLKSAMDGKNQRYNIPAPSFPFLTRQLQDIVDRQGWF